jgi:hypothetical protein
MPPNAWRIRNPSSTRLPDDSLGKSSCHREISRCMPAGRPRSSRSGLAQIAGMGTRACRQESSADRAAHLIIAGLNSPPRPKPSPQAELQNEEGRRQKEENVLRERARKCVRTAWRTVPTKEVMRNPSVVDCGMREPDVEAGRDAPGGRALPGAAVATVRGAGRRSGPL